MKGLLILAVQACLGLGGCIVHGHGKRAHVHGPVVVVPVAHVHSHSCGHYYHNGGWHHHAGHVHAGGCGHAFRGGMWVFLD
jgi:hypothetical protein